MKLPVIQPLVGAHGIIFKSMENKLRNFRRIRMIQIVARPWSARILKRVLLRLAASRISIKNIIYSWYENFARSKIIVFDWVITRVLSACIFFKFCQNVSSFFFKWGNIFFFLVFGIFLRVIAPYCVNLLSYRKDRTNRYSQQIFVTIAITLLHVQLLNNWKAYKHFLAQK